MCDGDLVNIITAVFSNNKVLPYEVLHLSCNIFLEFEKVVGSLWNVGLSQEVENIKSFLVMYANL